MSYRNRIDLPLSTVSASVKEVFYELAAEDWIPRFRVEQVCAERLTGEKWDFGDKFSGQVSRALNKLADTDPRVVKVGRGEAHHTIQGDYKVAHGNEALWTLVEFQQRCVDAHEKSEAARKAVGDRIKAATKKLHAHGFFADASIFVERHVDDPAERWGASFRVPLKEMEDLLKELKGEG